MKVKSHSMRSEAALQSACKVERYNKVMHFIFQTADCNNKIKQCSKYVASSFDLRTSRIQTIMTAGTVFVHRGRQSQEKLKFFVVALK